MIFHSYVSLPEGIFHGVDHWILLWKFFRNWRLFVGYITICHHLMGWMRWDFMDSNEQLHQDYTLVCGFEGTKLGLRSNKYNYIYIYHIIYICILLNICLLQLLPQNNSGSDGKYPRYPIKIGMAFTRCYDHKKMSISQSTNNVTTIRANLSNTLHIWRIYIRWNICTHTFAYSKLCIYIYNYIYNF